MHYLYVDESGCLGLEKGSKYFIVACIVTKCDPKELKKIIRNVRKIKSFQKELKKKLTKFMQTNVLQNLLNTSLQRLILYQTHTFILLFLKNTEYIAPIYKKTEINYTILSQENLQ